MASWPPKKNTAFTVVFPIFDADGDLVSGAASLDSEVSKDGGTFTDCTNEAGEIATSSGMYSLVLTSTEMNADIVATITKTGTAGAKTSPNVMYTSVNQVDDLSTALTTIDDFVDTEVAAILTAVDTEIGTILTRLGTPSDLGGGASVAANLSDIEAQTDDIGAAGAGLTAVPWNATWDAEVESEANDALIAQNLDHLVKVAVDTNFATTVHLDSVIGQLADNGTTATFDRATDSLEALQAAIDTIDNFVDSEVGTIVTAVGNIETDTQDIQSRLPAALVSGRIDASIGAMAANVLTASALAADAVTEIFDAIMKGDIDTVEGTAAIHSLCTAILKAVSLVQDDGAGLIVTYRTDGTTAHMEQAVAVDAALDPIESIGVGVAA
jgi:hypothetical protein